MRNSGALNLAGPLRDAAGAWNEGIWPESWSFTAMPELARELRTRSAVSGDSGN